MMPFISPSPFLFMIVNMRLCLDYIPLQLVYAVFLLMIL